MRYEKGTEKVKSIGCGQINNRVFEYKHTSAKAIKLRQQQINNRRCIASTQSMPP